VTRLIVGNPAGVGDDINLGLMNILPCGKRWVYATPAADKLQVSASQDSCWIEVSLCVVPQSIAMMSFSSPPHFVSKLIMTRRA
jgi:hypothetical protein